MRRKLSERFSISDERLFIRDLIGECENERVSFIYVNSNTGKKFMRFRMISSGAFCINSKTLIILFQAIYKTDVR